MKNTVIGLIAILILTLPFADTSAQKRKMNMDDSFRGLDQLQLSEDQQKQIDDLRMTHKSQMIDLRAELSKSRLENQKLRTSGNFSRSDLLSQTRKMNEIRNRIAESRANHFMDVYELLNDDQKKIWSSMKHDRQGKRINKERINRREFNRDAW